MRKAAWQLTAFAVFVAALVVDPFYLWRPHYDYDAADLRAAVEGTWKVTLSGETITLAITQGGPADDRHAERSLIAPAAACGERTMVRSASACMDVTRMPLHVAVIGGGPRAARGELLVGSTQFTTASLELTVGDVGIGATVMPDGAVRQVAATDRGEVTLVRTARL